MRREQSTLYEWEYETATAAATQPDLIERRGVEEEELHGHEFGQRGHGAPQSPQLLQVRLELVQRVPARVADARLPHNARRQERVHSPLGVRSQETRERLVHLNVPVRV